MKLKNLLLEALKPSQFRKYMKSDARPNKIIQDELDAKFKAFTGQKNRSGDRLYIPFTLNDKQKSTLKNSDLDIANVIENLFEKLGYTIKIPNIPDYHSISLDNSTYMQGTCRKRTSDDKREFKIGKILNKFKDKSDTLNISIPYTLRSKIKDIKSIIQLYNEDPVRSVQNTNYLICISKHPYDIAGMSTDRGWRSCMNLVDGAYKQKINPLIKEGGLVVYLIREDDLNIEHPIGRVTIYTLSNPTDENDKAWSQGNVCYGSILNQDGIRTLFLDTVSNFIKNNLLQDKKGYYTKDAGQYNEISDAYLKLGNPESGDVILLLGATLTENNYSFYDDEDLDMLLPDEYDSLSDEIAKLSGKITTSKELDKKVCDLLAKVDTSDLYSNDYFYDRFSEMWADSEQQYYLDNNLDDLVYGKFDTKKKCLNLLLDLLGEETFDEEFKDEDGEIKSDLTLPDLQDKIRELLSDGDFDLYEIFENELDNERDNFIERCNSDISITITAKVLFKGEVEEIYW